MLPALRQRLKEVNLRGVVWTFLKPPFVYILILIGIPIKRNTDCATNKIVTYMPSMRVVYCFHR